MFFYGPSPQWWGGENGPEGSFLWDMPVSYSRIYVLQDRLFVFVKNGLENPKIQPRPWPESVHGTWQFHIRASISRTKRAIGQHDSQCLYMVECWNLKLNQPNDTFSEYSDLAERQAARKHPIIWGLSYRVFFYWSRPKSSKYGTSPTE